MEDWPRQALLMPQHLLAKFVILVLGVAMFQGVYVPTKRLAFSYSGIRLTHLEGSLLSY